MRWVFVCTSCPHPAVTVWDGRAEIIVGAGLDPRKKAEMVIVYQEDLPKRWDSNKRVPGLSG